MKILFFADMHLRSPSDRPKWRTDDHYKSQFNELYEISDIARDEEIDVIVSLGDFFDHTRVSHQLVTDVLKWTRQLPCYTCSIVGNHDVNAYVTTDRNNGLGVLFESGAIHQLKELSFDEQKVIIRAVDVYMDPRQGDYFFTDKKHDDYYKIVASHNFIIPHEVPFDAVLPSQVKTNANAIVLGHYHKAFFKQEGSTYFINPGSISRWAINEQHHPQVLLLDTVTGKMESRPLNSSLPASEIFNLEAAAELQSTELNFQSFIDSLKNTSFENLDVEKVVLAEGKKQNIATEILDVSLEKIRKAKEELV